MRSTEHNRCPIKRSRCKCGYRRLVYGMSEHRRIENNHVKRHAHSCRRSNRIIILIYKRHADLIISFRDTVGALGKTLVTCIIAYSININDIRSKSCGRYRWADIKARHGWITVLRLENFNRIFIKIFDNERSSYILIQPACGINNNQLNNCRVMFPN